MGPAAGAQEERRGRGQGEGQGGPALERHRSGPAGSRPPGAVELLYSLDPTQWSRGLATEAATAVLAYAVDVLALPEILATTDGANTPSIRTLTRLGATPMPCLQVGPDTYPCYRLHPQPPGYAPSEPL